MKINLKFLAVDSLIYNVIYKKRIILLERVRALYCYVVANTINVIVHANTVIMYTVKSIFLNNEH